MPVTFNRAYRRPRTIHCVDQQYAPPAPPATAAIADPRRFAPLAASALVALIAGVVMGAGHVPDERKTADAFAEAWERGDTRGDVRAAQRRRQAAHDAAAPASAPTSRRRRRSRWRRSAPGRSSTTRRSRSSSRPASSARCKGNLVAPDRRAQGRRPGRRLARRARLPRPAARREAAARDVAARRGRRSRPATAPRWPRARTACPTSDRSPRELAGHDRARAAGAAQAELEARGVPAGAAVGLTGLEREFDERLTGTPGGVLFAGKRVLANVKPKPGSAVRTTIDPKIQRAAVDALAGRYGGIAVVRPADGEVLALAGHRPSRARSRPARPSRSSRSPASLDNKIAKRNSTYPIQNAATIEGVEIQNANGESCGGSLRDLLRALLQQRLRAAGRQARRGEARRDRREVRLQRGAADRRRGAHDDPRRGRDRRRPRRRLVRDRPGQGARDAAADGARRRARSAPTACARTPTLLKGDDPQRVRATSKSVARTIKSYMRTVVTDGTGGGRGARRHQGLGQDRHRGAADDRQGGAAAGGHRPGAAAAGGRRDGHRRLVRRLRALHASRRSPSR